MGVVAGAQVAGAVTVDNLADNQGALSTSGTSSSSVTAAVGTILGSERDMQVSLASGSGPVTADVGVSTASVLTFTSPAGTSGMLTVQWDGSDGASTLNPTGLGSVDLTAGGDSAFSIPINSASAGLELKIEVYSSAQSVSIFRRVLPAISAATTLVIAYSDFSGNATFSNVGAVVLMLTGDGVSGALGASIATATAAPIVGATKADALVVTTDADADGEVDPGEQIEYTIDITNTGSTATSVQLSDTLDTNTTFVAGSLDSTPLALDDAYTSIGNVGITVPAGAGLLANDTDPDGSGLAAVPIAAFDATSAQGGPVSVTTTDGSFTYTPPIGFEGVDFFSYTIADGEGSGDTATVLITVSNVIWFIDNSLGTAGNGTLATPFNTLAAFEALNGNGGATDPEMGDCIFLYTGAGNYTGGVTLESAQILAGQGAGAALATVCGIVSTPTHSNALPGTGGTRPVIVNGSGNGITLASGNSVRGLDVGNTTGGAGVFGSGFGTFFARTASVTGSGQALDLTSGSLDVIVDSLSATTTGGGNPGIELNSVSGAMTVTTTNITNPGGGNDGIDVTNSSAALDFGATTVSKSGAGNGIDLTSSASGSFTFDSLSVTTASGKGFSANNSGTVNLGGAANMIASTSGTALEMTDTLIGAGGFTFQSISANGSGGASVGIILDDTGTGSFTVNGVGTTGGSGGTIENMVADGMTLNNTDGLVTLKNMIFEDIGSTAGAVDTRSQHDGIHGQTVDGGLTLDNVTIRRISDQGVNGASFADGVSATTWSGLTVTNSLIEDTNRFHVAGVADNQDEGAIRIVGLSGTASVTGSTFRRGAALLELFSASSGTLGVTVRSSAFEDAYKEFAGGSPAASLGRFGISITSEGSANTTVTIGDQTDTTPGNQTGDNGNTFIDCKSASVLVAHQAGASGNLDAIVANNTFRVTDHSSTAGFGNFPQGGVALRMRGGTLDGIVEYNQFGVAVGPDDRIGSTDDEVMNAAGADGNVSLILENATGGGAGAVNGAAQVEVNNNQFNGSINSPLFVRGDRNSSAAVFIHDNAYRGRDDFFSPDPFFGTFTVPGIPTRIVVRNGGSLDVSIEDETHVFHDQVFFAQTETLEFRSLNVGGGGTLCVALDNAASGDGFELTEELGAGTVELFQGAVNNAATGPCSAGSTGDCEAELADDGVRGGPSTRDQSTGTPDPTLNPPFVDVDGGSITITGTACTKPSGGIF